MMAVFLGVVPGNGGDDGWLPRIWRSAPPCLDCGTYFAHNPHCPWYTQPSQRVSIIASLPRWVLVALVSVAAAVALTVLVMRVMG